METKGWDLALGFKDNPGKKFSYSANLTLTHFKSNVKYLSTSDPIIGGEANELISTFRSRTTVGHAPGAWWGFIVDGVFQSDEEAAGYVNKNNERLQPAATAGDLKFRDFNNDGKIDNSDLSDIGSPYPDLSAGLTITLNYAGFDFRTDLYGVFGADNFNNYRRNMVAGSNYNFLSGFQDQFWTGPGTSNSFPVLRKADPNGNFTKMSTFFLEKGSFVRANLMQLGYTVPNNFIRGIKNLRVFVSAQNLFTITNYSGLNPDVPWYSSITYSGMDNYQMPPVRTYMFGLNLSCNPKNEVMKRIIIYIFAAGLPLAGAVSCNLDQAPYGSSIVAGEFYKTDEQCNGATQVAYRYINYSSWWEILNWRYLAGEASSDNGWIGNTYQAHPTYDAAGHYFIDAGNDRNEAQWVNLYKSIGRFNSTMEGIGAAPIAEASKKQYIAELKFLRAWCYFDLVRNWGGVPLILKVLPPNEHPARNSVQEVYGQILKDLNEAAGVLPKKSVYPRGALPGFRGAALALMAKISLYMEDWAKAEGYAQTVISENDYDLEPQFSDLWQYTYRMGQESVFEIMNGSSQVPALPYNEFAVVLNSAGDGGWGYYSVTSDLENAYKSEGDSIRLQWTINRHGLPVAGDPNAPSFDGRPFPHRPIANPRGSAGSITFRSHSARPTAAPPSTIRSCVSQTCCSSTEACAMQQKYGPALNSLKRVRGRVLLETDMALTGWPLINAIRKERRLELAYEGDRLYDIRRWKDAAGAPVINSLFGPNGSFVKYNTETSTDPFETANTTEAQDKGAKYDPKIHALWPIPASQVLLSEGAVKQNPGYF